MTMKNTHWLSALPSACLTINDAAAMLGDALLDHDRVGTQSALRKIVLATTDMRSRAGLPAASVEPFDEEHESPGAVVAEAVSTLLAICDETAHLSVLGLTLRLEELRSAQEPTDPIQALTDALESIESRARGLARTLNMDLS